MPQSLTTSKQEKRFSLEDLHPYQLDAVEIIKEYSACALWITMGGGKTIAVLTAISDLFNDFTINKVLVIAPLRVVQDVWPEEIRKWQHTKNLTFTVIHGPNKEQLLQENTDLHLINREQVCWLVDVLKNDWPYDTVIIDESSSFKSHRAKRFKALKKVRHVIERIVEMTGTPASNSLLDLWAQIYLLDKGERLGRTFTGFRDRYFESDYLGYNWSPRLGSKEDIYEKLSDICITISDNKAPKVKKPRHNFINVDFPAKVRQEYLQLERHFLLELESECIEVFSAAALSNKLLQFCNGALYREDKTWMEIHNEKLKVLEEIIESTVGEPLFLAYTFQSDKARILKKFPQTVHINEKDAVARWNAGEIPILLGHPASAGHGLNLQFGGHIACWFGLNWSLELYNQFNARLPREGQIHDVIIHHIVMKDSIEETVLTALENKETTEQELLQALKQDMRRRVK